MELVVLFLIQENIRLVSRDETHIAVVLSNLSTLKEHLDLFLFLCPSFGGSWVCRGGAWGLGPKRPDQGPRGWPFSSPGGLPRPQD